MRKILLMILAVAVSGSCGIYSNYNRPEDAPSDLYGNSKVEGADSSSLADIKWEQLFTDSLLRELIRTGLAQNVDVASAEQTILQAQAAYKASKLAFIPGFSFAPQGEVTTSGSTTAWSYSVPVVMNWELDIFGKMRNTKRKSAATLEMAYDLSQATKTQVVANIANFYYQLLMLDEKLSVMEQTALNWNETLRIMKAMKEAGMQNEASVAQTTATCYTINISILEVRKQIINTENALCILLKQTSRRIDRGTISQQTFPEELKVGVSAQLLDRRPDVRVAERSLESYFYGVNYARSQFYPSVNITATGLWNGSFLFDALASLAQPVFARGSLKAGLEAAKGEFEKAKLSYEQKLIQAGTDVNNALLQCQTAREKQELYLGQIDALKSAVKSTQALMNYGSTTYLDVIYAQQSLLEAQTSVLSNWLDEATGVISLYQSLGGGAE